MKQLALYKNGAVVILDSESPHSVSVVGQEPIEIIEATDENMDKYFPKRKESVIKLAK